MTFYIDEEHFKGKINYFYIHFLSISGKSSSYDLDLQFNSDEARLRLALLDRYVPEARPVVNTTTVTVVDVGLTIIQVMDLVS
jgi:hypothetical protein